jgi:hypothetical protein
MLLLLVLSSSDDDDDVFPAAVALLHVDEDNVDVDSKSGTARLIDTLSLMFIVAAVVADVVVDVVVDVGVEAGRYI